ncbi:MAG: chromate transporter [Erysipelotrichaceae bacterium]|nr:chromate transporter [Erysipelotrichaceae bacterium]MBR5754938.1 chromate transporter [Erysipelotrichaceae bacterium]
MITILDIFLNFLKIGLFAFGGAYAVVPLIEEQMVTNTGWMNFTEFTDLLAIDELTPGPIIINSSTYIGMKLGGVPGALAATLGCIIPGAIVSLLLIHLYTKYKEIPVVTEIVRTLKCMSVALILSVLLKMFMNTLFPESISLQGMDILSAAMMVACFYVIRKYKTNPLYVMLVCGTINLIVCLISK